MEGLTPICPYCKSFSRKTNGSEIYPHLKEFKDSVFYICTPCDAYVGTHKDSSKPLGRLSNAELRGWKMKAHRVFDSLWKDNHMTRREAYQWLADQLEINIDDCHIGMFDIETCIKTVEVSRNWRRP